MRHASLIRTSGAARFAHHDAYEIGCVLRPQLLHDPRAMNFDRARTDAEMATCLLVRSASGDLCEHLAFARRQRIATREGHGQHVGAAASLLSPFPCFDRLAYARDDRIGI